MKITKEQLSKIYPSNKNIDALVTILNKFFATYDISTVNRIAGFLAQVGHESHDCTILKENLNYSAKGLLTTFKKYFPTEALANSYQRNPEKIANKVYSSRLGNGNEQSGDGWKFRGRGAIQLTGKNNYSLFALSIKKSLDETIKYLETLEGAIESACWFWKNNNLNSYCDRDDIVGMTKKINGGTIGLEDRKKRYALAKSIL